MEKAEINYSRTLKSWEDDICLEIRRAANLGYFGIKFIFTKEITSESKIFKTIVEDLRINGYTVVHGKAKSDSVINVYWL